MLRQTLVLVAASMPMLACSASTRHGVRTTEAASGIEQITRSDRNEFDPAISPDGKAIAYDVADSADDPPHVEVMALGGASTDRHPPVEYRAADAMSREPAWMPDGSGLVFESNALGRHRLVQTVGDGPGRTRFLANVGNPRLFAAWPALSPDGSRIAMTLSLTEVFQSGWRSARPLDVAIGISDLFGSGVTVLGPGTAPAWSPDGRRIAFVRTADGHSHVFVGAADGTDAQQITDGPDDDEQPAWSPDGSSLVFCSAHRSDSGWTQANLFAVHSDGSGMVQLTEGDRVAGRPDWARDGFIYFHANATDHFHIWRVRPL